MDKQQVEQLLILNSSKIAPEALPLVRQRLLTVEDYTLAQLVFSQLKDPTIALVLSIVLGVYGVDRFYVGDVGIGVGKLVTCGGAGIWYIVDIFMIMDAAKRKNMEILLSQLR